MQINFQNIWKSLSSIFTVSHNKPSSNLWVQNGSYPPRPGNEIQIFIDGQEAYLNIATAFHSAKKFIYLTISYGDEDSASFRKMVKRCLTFSGLAKRMGLMSAW